MSGLSMSIIPPTDNYGELSTPGMICPCAETMGCKKKQETQLQPSWRLQSNKSLEVVKILHVPLMLHSLFLYL